MSTLNRNKKLTFVKNLFKNNKYNTKIKIYFSKKSYGDFYDDFEDNATYIKLNPVTIKGYVHSITAMALVFKQYGLENQNAKEVITDSKYKSWFEDCEKIEIDGEEYQVFKEAAGQNMIIHERAFKIIRVVLQRRTQ